MPTKPTKSAAKAKKAPAAKTVSKAKAKPAAKTAITSVSKRPPTPKVNLMAVTFAGAAIIFLIAAAFLYWIVQSSGMTKDYSVGNVSSTSSKTSAGRPMNGSTTSGVMRPGGR